MVIKYYIERSKQAWLSIHLHEVLLTQHGPLQMRGEFLSIVVLKTVDTCYDNAAGQLQCTLTR
jgi:hypothetical protein